MLDHLARLGAILARTRRAFISRRRCRRGRASSTRRLDDGRASEGVARRRMRPHAHAALVRETRAARGSPGTRLYDGWEAAQQSPPRTGSPPLPRSPPATGTRPAATTSTASAPAVLLPGPALQAPSTPPGFPCRGTPRRARLAVPAETQTKSAPPSSSLDRPRAGSSRPSFPRRRRGARRPWRGCRSDARCSCTRR